MSEAEALLEEGIAFLKARKQPLCPLGVLTELGQMFPEQDLAQVRAYFLIRTQCGITLTDWYLQCRRTHADVLKLFQDALWEAQTGGGE